MLSIGLKGLVTTGLLLLPLDATAQWAEWDEPTIIDMNHPPPATQVFEPTAGARYIDASEIPNPLTYEEVAELRELVESATVEVVAIHRRHPMIVPNIEERRGAATLIQTEDGPVFITALSLVENAESVRFELDGRLVSAVVTSDARYGLAILAPEEPIAAGVRSLPLSTANANDRVETFSAGGGTASGTMGRGLDHSAYYQVNSSGVVFGYPLINRHGEIIGVGSHRYISDPSLTLSVPSSAVREFLDATALD